MEIGAIQQIIVGALSNLNENTFDVIMRKFEDYHNRIVTTVQERKDRDSKKSKGDTWERFCYLYLINKENQYGQKLYTNVWLWSDVPPQVMQFLKLNPTRQDNGIDIITLLYNGNYQAIQCKYLNDEKKCVSWNTLSTFYGMCSRSGPWDKHIVMTTGKGVTNKLPKNDIARGLDLNLCIGTFRAITRTMFQKMAGGQNYIEHRLTDPDISQNFSNLQTSLPGLIPSSDPNPTSYFPQTQPGFHPTSTFPTPSQPGSFPTSTFPQPTQPGSFPTSTFPQPTQPGSFPTSTFPQPTQPGSFPSATFPQPTQPGSFPTSTFPQPTQPGSFPSATFPQPTQPGSFPSATFPQPTQPGSFPSATFPQPTQPGSFPSATFPQPTQPGSFTPSTFPQPIQSGSYPPSNYISQSSSSSSNLPFPVYNPPFQGSNQQVHSQNPVSTPQFQGVGPQFQGVGPQFQGVGPQFQGVGPQFQGVGPQFQGQHQGPSQGSITSNVGGRGKAGSVRGSREGRGGGRGRGGGTVLGSGQNVMGFEPSGPSDGNIQLLYQKECPLNESPFPTGGSFMMRQPVGNNWNGGGSPAVRAFVGKPKTPDELRNRRVSFFESQFEKEKEEKNERK